METIKRIPIKYKNVTYMPEYEDLRFGTIYISTKYNHSSHLCMCGCGNKIDNPLTNSDWSIEIDKEKKLSMMPSIINKHLPCESHYIIQKGKGNMIHSIAIEERKVIEMADNEYEE